MTPTEIKSLIQNTIAGQGSQVDIGGKLAEILGAIVDIIPNPDDQVKPIVLSAEPVDGETPESLAEKGLTSNEVLAASQGKRCAVVIGVQSYLITQVTYVSETEWYLWFSYFNLAGDGIDGFSQWNVERDGNGITVIEGSL